MLPPLIHRCSRLLLGGLCLAVLGCGAANEETMSATLTPKTPEKSPAAGAQSMLSVQREPYGTLENGQTVEQYTLTNSHGTQVDVITWGGIITQVKTPDQAGQFANIVLGFDSLDDYLVNKPYLGGICGRFANRIRNAEFTLDDKTYQLAKNSGQHHIHGGVTSFIKKLWAGEPVQEPDAVGVKLRYISADGEEGYPGTLTNIVTYRLNENNELRIDYEVTTDKPTVLNITNHSYWNLSGKPGSTILDHELVIPADSYVAIDEDAIPTGELTPVDGTCMDFRQPHTIGERITETVNGHGGYDHCYVINGKAGDLRPTAKVVHPATGRVMEVSTTEPGVQLYTGNYLEGTPETAGAPKQGAFCLEAQHLPDSPNQPKFPTTRLNPGETYRQTTVHRFSVLP